MTDKLATLELNMNGEPDPLHRSITAALKGDFQMVKPHACQPPNSIHCSIGTDKSRSKRSDRIIAPPNSQRSLVKHSTENQLDSSVLTLDYLSDEFDTAHSQSEDLSFYENGKSDVEHHEFLIAEKLVDREDIPDDVKEELIFCHHPDKYTRLVSNINWQAGKTVNKLDCSAQIMAKSMVAVANGQLQSNSSKNSNSKSLPVITEFTIDPTESEPTQTTVEEVKKKRKNCRECASDTNCLQSASLSGLNSRSSSAGLVYYMDNMITGQTNDKTNLHKPLRQLSPKRKEEVNNFLKETAETLDLTSMSFNTSKSSYELLHSIIREARKKYGGSKNHWSKKFPDAVENSKIDKVTLSKSDTRIKESTRSTREAKSDVMVFKGIPAKQTPNKNKNSKLPSPSIRKQERKNSKPGKSPKKNGGDNQQKKKSSKLYHHYEQCHEPCKVHFDVTSELDMQTAENTECNIGSISSDGLLSESTMFFSCVDNLAPHSAGGKCTCHRTGQQLNRPHNLVSLPKVEMFSKSTKSGYNQFYEILKAKLSIPTDEDKYEIIGPTVPIPLQSEAHLLNGELNLIVKEIDRDLVLLPKRIREQFTKVPHFINIDFVREFKETRTSPLQNHQQLSPAMLKTLYTRTPPVVRDKKPMPYPTVEKPFNTKVDYVSKKEPLVVGTLSQKDKKTAQNRTIRSTKIASKSTPMYCVL